MTQEHDPRPKWQAMAELKWKDDEGKDCSMARGTVFRAELVDYDDERLGLLMDDATTQWFHQTQVWEVEKVTFVMAGAGSGIAMVPVDLFPGIYKRFQETRGSGDGTPGNFMDWLRTQGFRVYDVAVGMAGGVGKSPLAEAVRKKTDPPTWEALEDIVQVSFDFRGSREEDILWKKGERFFGSEISGDELTLKLKVSGGQEVTVNRKSVKLLGVL